MKNAVIMLQFTKNQVFFLYFTQINFQINLYYIFLENVYFIL